MNAIDIKNLHFRYPDGRAALRGVSFSVTQGECVGLIGPNGAGKSTLLLHLNGILPETVDSSSCVRVFGQELTTANLREVRRRVGLLFQDPNDQLFCPTVFEDVAFGPRQFGMAEAEMQQLVHDSLQRVGLAGFNNRAPHHLSGGEKRLVCLAGVLSCRPEILVLDEPTSNLDPRSKRHLKELLKQIPITQIIATHDLELVAELCSRVLVLDQGCVVAEGTTRHILDDEDLMLSHGLERPHILQHRHPH